MTGPFRDHHGRVRRIAVRDSAIRAFSIPAKFVSGTEKIEVLKNIKEFVLWDLIIPPHNINRDLFVG